MSVKSEINRITINISSAYTALAEKGATMPDRQNSENLAETILSVSTGVDLPELSNPASESEVFLDKEYIDSEGNAKTGTMPNNGAISYTMDGINDKTVAIPSGYTSGGTVSLTDDIDNHVDTQADLITQIQTALQGKAAGGGSGLPTQEKTVEINENGTVEVLPDDGYTLSKVTATVDVPIPDGYIQPSGTLEVTANGTHSVAEYEVVNVNVPTSDGSDDVIPWITREVTEYSNPTLTTLGAYALSGTNVTSLNLPALTTIAGYAFYECTKLTYVNFPLLTNVPNNGFRSFKGLVKADLASITWIRSNGFYQCTNLETLILRGATVCSLVSGTTFTGTKIANGTGYIYVPSALIDSYKAATNWSNFASQFRAIEDYPDVCGG